MGCLPPFIFVPKFHTGGMIFIPHRTHPAAHTPEGDEKRRPLPPPVKDHGVPFRTPGCSSKSCIKPVKWCLTVTAFPTPAPAPAKRVPGAQETLHYPRKCSAGAAFRQFPSRHCRNTSLSQRPSRGLAFITVKTIRRTLLRPFDGTGHRTNHGRLYLASESFFARAIRTREVRICDFPGNSARRHRD